MDYKEIKEMIRDMEESKLSSLAIEFPDGFKISMEKNIVGKPIVLSEKQEELPKQEENVDKQDYKIIKSPMVGTFYASSNPNNPPYIKLGDKVRKSQVVCIVEAMKLMNEIESEFDGEIAEICVKDGEAVGYGTPLFKLK